MNNAIIDTTHGTNLLIITKDNQINLIVQKGDMECDIYMSYTNFLKICIIGDKKAARINTATLSIGEEKIECNLAVSITKNSTLKVYKVDSKEEILSVAMGNIYKKLIVNILDSVKESEYNLYIATNRKNIADSDDMRDAILDKSLDIVMAYRSSDVLKSMFEKHGLNTVWRVQKFKGGVF